MCSGIGSQISRGADSCVEQLENQRSDQTVDMWLKACFEVDKGNYPEFRTTNPRKVKGHVKLKDIRGNQGIVTVNELSLVK